MIYIIVALVCIIINYIFLKPIFYGNKRRIYKFLKMGTWIMFLAAVFYVFVNHLELFAKPKSLTQAVELLKSNKDVIDKIGGYESFSYYKYDLPKDEDNPALLKFSIKGSKAVIYISCRIEKDSLSKWKFLQLKQDSLIKLQ